MNFSPRPLTAGLYFVSTPIGTARDITLRALDILASADVIAAEDTRTAKKLMDIHGVAINGRQLIAFHDHSTEKMAERLIQNVKDGQSVAYVSEAGTPLVADPGYELGVIAARADVPIHAAPGASAVLAALTVSGLPTDRFCFIGFLPTQKSQRATQIAELRDLPMTLIFYEAPGRVSELLANLCDILGAERQATVCRELTKKFEEVSRGTLGELNDAFQKRRLKGEVVVLVGRAGMTAIADEDIQMALQDALQNMRIKDAATLVAGAMGLPRRQVYQRALDMKSEPDEGTNP
jgi:16S rRNA (cytidine1402-2'-O)-methyltransferase